MKLEANRMCNLEYNEVHILAVGYSSQDPYDSESMFANCSSTLIKSRCGKNIIIDTRTAWDGENLVKELEKHCIEPKDVNYVVCTHGHSDHIGCNYLFTSAEWHFVGTCMSRRDKYPSCRWDRPFQLINNEVQIIHTPGHTLNCVSLLINNTLLGGTVGVCGDLFENEQDVWDSRIWLNAGSENPQLQRQNRFKMASLCSYIIPGHGPGFVVTDAVKSKLEHDLSESSHIA